MMIRRVKKTRKDSNWRLSRIPKMIQISGINGILYTIETRKGISGLVYGDIVKSRNTEISCMFIGITETNTHPPFPEGCFVDIPRSLTSASKKNLGKMYFLEGMPSRDDYPIHTKSIIVEDRIAIEQVKVPN